MNRCQYRAVMLVTSLLSFAACCVSLTAQDAFEPAKLIHDQDRDGDEKISLEEAFPAEHPLAEFPDVKERMTTVFGIADSNRDGTLSFRELSRAPTALRYLNWLQRVQTDLMESFNITDSDKNGNLSLEELLAAFPSHEHADIQLWKNLLDFNDDGELSFTEYVLLPQYASQEWIFGVADPVNDAAQAVIQDARQRFTEFDRDQDGQLNTEEWRAFSSGKFYASVRDLIDANRDGRISLPELETGLNVAYGITNADGTRLTRGDGTTFSWRRFIEEIDANRDLKISRNEIGDRLPQVLSPEGQDALFTELDLNQDQLLDSTELALAGELRVPHTWINQFEKFLQFDVNRDGRLSLEELQVQVPPWEQKYVPTIFPAYDRNGDGLLSFKEYRATPFANFYLLWMDHRDANNDGYLTLDEFHTGRGLHFLGISKLFLDTLDQDQDGKLSLLEYDFETDMALSPTALLPSVFDTNRDQQVSRSELFSQGPVPHILSVLAPHYDEMIQKADKNGDQLISVSELDSAPVLKSQLVHLWKLSRDIAPAFAKADADQNGLLSVSEWETMSGRPRGTTENQYWKVIDFDGDQQLSFVEYLCWPGIIPTEARVGVPDPILDAALHEIDSAREQFSTVDLDQDSRLNRTEFNALSKGKFYHLYFDQLDHNQDQHLTFEELERGLLYAFGVADFSGTPLRRPSGEVFNWRSSIEEIDLNRDLQNDFQEHLRRPYPPHSTEQLTALFHDLDKDNNQRLSVKELAEAGSQKLLNSWHDLLSKFLELDQDKDGQLSLNDLAATVVPWEKMYIESMFPAYDTNKDGSISFLEFRASPLGNHTLIWADQQDFNGDGYLSPEEFHPRAGLPFSGVSKVFFDQLDENKDGLLSVNEYRFPLNLNKIPTTVAFKIFDKNRDSIIDTDEYLTESLKSFPQDLSEYDRRSVMMKLEEAFRYADRNRDGDISYEEFRDSQSALGLTPAQPREVDPAIVEKYTPQKPDTKPMDPTWKWYIIGGINIATWLVIGWWFLRGK